MNAYRKKIFSLISDHLRDISPLNVMDYGSGDGWFAHKLYKEGIVKNVVAVDIIKRAHAYLEPQIYNGSKLPFENRYFDLVYSMDVLHHCSNPIKNLKDLLRCCGKYFLIKDHTHSNFLEWLTLVVLDIIGNYKFDVPLVFKYQYEFEWFHAIENEGFILKWFLYPAPCHSGFLGSMTNNLQFISLWERL